MAGPFLAHAPLARRTRNTAFTLLTPSYFLTGYAVETEWRLLPRPLTPAAGTS
jgi:hypothetical protein